MSTAWPSGVWLSGYDAFLHISAPGFLSSAVHSLFPAVPILSGQIASYNRPAGCVVGLVSGRSPGPD